MLARRAPTPVRCRTCSFSRQATSKCVIEEGALAWGRKPHSLMQAALSRRRCRISRGAVARFTSTTFPRFRRRRRRHIQHLRPRLPILQFRLPPSRQPLLQRRRQQFLQCRRLPSRPNQPLLQLIRQLKPQPPIGQRLLPTQCCRRSTTEGAARRSRQRSSAKKLRKRKKRRKTR